MAVKAKYVAPLQVLETKPKRDRINAIAEAEGISQAEVIRDLIEHGLEWRESLSRGLVQSAAGEVTPAEA